jgi:hypothetical protein
LGLITVVGSFKLYAVSYAVSTLSVVRKRLGLVRKRLGFMKRLGLLRERLGLLRLSVASFLVDTDFFALLLRSVLLGLSVACALVDAKLFTVLMRLGRKLLGRLLRRLLELMGLLGTTETLFFVDADLFLDVGVVVFVMLVMFLRGRRLLDGGGEGFVDFFVTFPSV